MNKNLHLSSVKSCITSPPTLSCPNFELPLTLQTNASSVGLGAVLTQESEGVEHVIAFASRALSEAEKKYSTTEQECLLSSGRLKSLDRISRDISLKSLRIIIAYDGYII